MGKSDSDKREEHPKKELAPDRAIVTPDAKNATFCRWRSAPTKLLRWSLASQRDVWRFLRLLFLQASRLASPISGAAHWRLLVPGTLCVIGSLGLPTAADIITGILLIAIDMPFLT